MTSSKFTRSSMEFKEDETLVKETLKDAGVSAKKTWRTGAKVWWLKLFKKQLEFEID